MKKIVTTLILMLSGIFLFVRCVGDPLYEVDYIYKNTTDYPVKLSLFSEYNHVPMKVFVIEPNNELLLEYSGRSGIPRPFAEFKTVLHKITIICNGLQIEENVDNTNSLLYKKGYTKINEYEYEFTFTDSYFANGTPVIP